jgi:hypothetical protein
MLKWILMAVSGCMYQPMAEEQYYEARTDE